MIDDISPGNGFDYRRMARLGGFYLVGSLFVVSMYAFVGSDIAVGLRSWITPVADDHRIHEITFTAMVLVATAGVAIQAYRPTVRVAALQTAIIIPLTGTVLSALTGGTVLEWGFFLVLTGVMGLFHPAGRELGRPFTASRFSPWLAGLVALAAIPLLAFVIDQATLQLTVVDEHTAEDHYAGQAAYALSIVSVGLLAAIQTRGWWFPAIATGVLAIAQGLASVFFTTASSVGPMWGGAEVLWGVVFLGIAAAEYRGMLSDASTDDPDSAGLS